MNIRDVVYETARQFAEIAASQHWIEARIGDLKAAATEVREALENQRSYFNQVLGIAQEVKKKRRKKPRKIVKRAKKAQPSRRKENQPK